MRKLRSLVLFCILPFVVLVSVQAFADAPQFALIQTDKASYAVGESASVSISILISPQNPDDEIVIVPTLAGSQIDVSKLSDMEWALITPALANAGVVSFQVGVYLENKNAATSLRETIAFYEEQVAQDQIALSNEHDPQGQASLQAEISRDQGLILIAQDNLLQGRRLVETDTQSITVNTTKAGSISKTTGSNPSDSDPVFVLDADRSNRIYHSGEVATFSVSLLTSFVGADGPQEAVARAQVDGSTVSGVQGSSKEFSFASNPFKDYQIGSGTFTATVLVRSKVHSDSLRDSIIQSAKRKDFFIADLNSTTDPDRQAYDRSQIQQLTTLIAQFNTLLEESLESVGTQTLDFTVTASERDIVLQNTEIAQTINVASQITSPSNTTATIVSVSQPSRGSVTLNANGTVTYTPDPTKPFRVFMADTSLSGAAGNQPGYDTYMIPLNDSIFFDSAASNLVPNSSGNGDGFSTSFQSGKVTLEALGVGSTVLNNGSYISNSSLNARFLNFISSSTNAVPGNTLGHLNSYVRDNWTGTLNLVSIDPSGNPGNADSDFGFLSGDGSQTVFESQATNLTAITPAPGVYQVYERDLLNGKTTLLSANYAQNPSVAGNGTSWDEDISVDGRYIIFSSNATNLSSPAPANDHFNCYVSDLQTRKLTLAGLDFNGQLPQADCQDTAITADGRYAIFQTNSLDFVSGASGTYLETYIRDLQQNTTTRLISSYTGGELNADTAEYDNSPDGRFVVFSTTATNVLPASALSGPLPGNGAEQCYFMDRSMNPPQTVLIGVSAGNAIANGDCADPLVSPDGHVVAFTAQASNVTGVNDGLYHTYAISKDDKFTYTATDSDGNSFTGTVTLTEPLMGVPASKRLK